jgi:hypothetical protein
LHGSSALADAKPTGFVGIRKESSAKGHGGEYQAGDQVIANKILPA